jgi:hypothetical protein
MLVTCRCYCYGDQKTLNVAACTSMSRLWRQNVYRIMVQEYINLRDRGGNVITQTTTFCDVISCSNTSVQPAASLVDSVHI